MSVKVTRKQIKENFNKIIKVGYCELQELLKFKTAEYYTAGAYGWNADIFKINNNTAICTGYRAFGNIEANHDIMKKYNNLAFEISNIKDLSYNDKKEKIEELLNEFIGICLK